MVALPFKQSRIISSLIILTLLISVVCQQPVEAATPKPKSPVEVHKVKLPPGQSLKDWLESHNAVKITPQPSSSDTKTKVSAKAKTLKEKAKVEAPKLKKQAKVLMKKAAKLAKKGGKKATAKAKKLKKKAKKLLKRANKYISDYRKQSEKDVMKWVANQGKK